MKENDPKPRMMTIPKVVKTGLFTEYALRLLLKQGKLPCVMVGRKALINYDRLVEQLEHL